MRFKLTHFEIINFEIEEIYEPLQFIKDMLDGVTLLPSSTFSLLERRNHG